MIYNYNQKNKIPFNQELFERSDDRIIEEVLKVARVCQRDRLFSIKITGHTIIDNPIEIDQILASQEETKIKAKRKKNNKVINSYKYISLKKTDVRLLIIHYMCIVGDERELFDVMICIPRVVNGNCFRIMGNYYTPMYQIVDSSTYNNSKAKSKKKDTVTISTIFDPVKIRIYRTYVKLKTVDKIDLKCMLYTSHISRNLDCMKYILAKFGLYETMEFLGLRNIIISEEYDESECDEWYIFCKRNIYVKVPKYIFDADNMTQSLVATILNSIHKSTKYPDMFTRRFWLGALSRDLSSPSVERGVSTLEYIQGLYDLATMDAIALPIEEKANIYLIFRWIMREFSNLRVKSNLDLGTKKVRYAEYIASFFAMRLSKGILRLSDKGPKVKCADIRKTFTTDPMYIIDKLSTSTLRMYKDTIGDLDCFDPLKITYKGVGGVGGEGGNASIPDSIRRVHPEYIGRLDLDASSGSDPGLTTMLTPFTSMENGKFDDIPEPLTWEKEYEEMLNNYQKLKGRKEVVLLKEKITGKFDKTFLEEVEEGLNMFENLIRPVRVVEKTAEYFCPVIVREETEGVEDE